MTDAGLLVRIAAVQIRRLALACLLLAALLAGCGDDDGADTEPASGDQTPSAPAAPESFAVGLVEQTYVDDTRVTPANGDIAELPERTLLTRVLYPAEGDATTPTPVVDAPPTAEGPFPLVVFVHGLGGSYESLEPLVSRWAAAGYVVAVPEFPLTNAATPGGPDAADVQRQPGDVSFVIDRVLAENEGDGPLVGVVDGELIAVAGHSNGAITTLGAVANSCCRDDRADAAIALAGTTASPFADGEYDLTDAPPILFVHGTDDQQVSYDSSVAMFNRALGPKGLLTIEGRDHGSWLAEGPDIELIAAVTIDFLDAELGGEPDAQASLEGFEADDMTLDWVADDGSTTTIPTIPPPETDRQVTIEPTTGLTDGQPIMVSWTGFLPDGTINVVQCAGDGTDSASCQLNDAFILQPNPTGEGSTTIEAVIGAVGDGVCDRSNPCSIVVNDSALEGDDATIRIPIAFAD